MRHAPPYPNEPTPHLYFDSTEAQATMCVYVMVGVVYLCRAPLHYIRI